MKKPKTVKEFSYKEISHEDFADELNKTIPVNLKYNEDLVERIHARYPFISKTQISIILTGVFQTFRDSLVVGNILNFHNLFFNTKIHIFDFTKKGHKVPAMKIKMSTPPKLKI